MSAREDQFHEESLWFGSADRPLFGRLTTPLGELTNGGILLSPPIGRESRLARRALRTLAIELAVDGYVSLRFDHFGTGDSSGSIDDEGFDRAWLEGVTQGVALLRSLGIASVSAVGMRMGATIVATAASSGDLGLSSFALWDPCESGRAYARELGALGALRRDAQAVGLGESMKMLEYPLSDEVARHIGGFTLIEPAARPMAERIMVVTRDDRTVSGEFRSRWDGNHVEWATTSEQGPLLETELPDSVQPASTIAKIRAWLTADESLPSPFSHPSPSLDAVVNGSNAAAVRERVVELGHRNMFGIVAEPVGDVHGPLVVMVNGINEDHVGPARLWVDFSRRWAGLGLRCVRFDFSELGESPWLPGQPERPVFDWTQRFDISEAVRALIPESPEDSIFVGLCSGAQVALEAALDLKTRGLYAINPQVGAGVLRSADRLRNSERETVRSSAHRFEKVLKRYPWIDDTVQEISRLVLLSAFSPRVRSALAKSNSQMLMVLGPNDLSPFRRIPVVGSLVGRQLLSSDHIRVEVVPGLDHDFLSTLGRARAIAVLDRYVVEAFSAST
jgi:pimeloyl-ACP methyl ester carboxylesterase